MPANLHAFSAGFLTLLATYLLHSTFLLGGAWLLLRGCRIRSHALNERIWKFAAVLGLFTAPLQWGVGATHPVFRFELNRSSHTETSAQPLHKLSKLETPGAIPQVFPIENSSVPQIDLVRGNTTSRQTADEAVSSVDIPAGAMTLIQSAEPASVEIVLDAEPLETASQKSSIPVPASMPLDTVPIAESQTFSTAAGFNIAAVALLSVMVAGLLRLGVQTVLFRRQLSGCRETPAGIARGLLQELLQKGGIRRRVRLLSSAAYPEPGAFGLFRWQIVLPQDIERKLDRDELRALLAHEVAHLVRGDALWLWVGHLLGACFTVQPLNFIARRNWQRSAEYLCDDWAVTHSGDPLSLARCLTQIAEWRLNRSVAAVTLAAGGPQAGVVSRVERLIDGDCRTDVWDGRFRRRLLGTVAVVVAFIIVCFAPGMSILAEQTPDVSLREVINSDKADDSSELPPALIEELHLLDQEIRALETELARVGKLLKQLPADPEIGQLAGRLLAQSDTLHKHRSRLTTFTLYQGMQSSPVEVTDGRE